MDYRYKRRIKDVIAADWIEFLRNHERLSHFINIVKTYNGTTILFGGILRDFILSDLNSTQQLLPKDVDIVCKLNDKNFEKLILELKEKFSFIKETIFGGFKFNCNGVVVDIWDFQKVNQFASGRMEPSEFNLLAGVPFNLMGIIYSLQENFVLSSDSFWSGLENKIIDFEDRVEVHRPSMQHLYANKAISFACKYGFQMSDEVLNYIVHYVKNGGELWNRSMIDNKFITNLFTK